jgi:predicted Zn-dependent protease
MQLRSAGALMNDALITEYIKTLGAQLVGHASDGTQDFEFFMVDDDAINAFAMPGGFIGVNAGLIMASQNESEIAGVLAHEVAHVTQRHLARRIYDSKKTGMLSLATMLATMILGTTTDMGGEAMGGIITATQAATVQRQINFTRSNEREADRLGIRTLSSAGFDPAGMGTFFEKLSRRFGSAGPAMLRTHPVTTERIAEARDRARLLPNPKVTSSIDYEIIKARLDVLRASSSEAAFNLFRERLQGNSQNIGDYYGMALSLSRMGLDDDAQRQFEELTEKYPSVIAFRIGKAESLLKNGDIKAAIEVYAKAIKLFPRNTPLTNSYSDALIVSGDAEAAHDLLLDLLNNSSPTPEQFRLIAQAANANGDMGNAHHYMSHYYSTIGNYPDALTQIQMALGSPGVNPVDRARFESELLTYEGVSED